MTSTPRRDFAPPIRQSAPSRRHFLGTASAAALAGIAGLRRAQARTPGTLVFALSAFPPNFRPWSNVGTAAETVKLQSFRGLFSYANDGSVRPEIAESMQRENDRTYLIKLRPNAKFHNGDAVTAEDVKFSFEAIGAERSEAYLRADFAAIQRIEAVDARTVRIVLPQPNATFNYLLAHYDAPIVSKRSMQDNPNAPIGAGPYRVTGMERGTRIELEAFPDFYKPGLPRSRKLQFVVYADDSLRVAALEAGDVDIIEYVPAQSMAMIERRSDLRLDAVDGPATYITFNFRQGPFQNQKLRQAVGFAIDRDAIVRGAFSGRGSALGGMLIPPTSPFFNRDLAGYFRYDPERARRLVAEAGFPNGLSTTLLATSQYAVHKDVAEVVQPFLDAVGIRTQLNLPDWATRVQLANRGQYEIAVTATSGDSNDPDSLRSVLGGNLAANVSRPFGYANPQLDELLAAGRAELDERKRHDIYGRAERVALEDAGIVPLMWRSQGYAMRRGIEGFKNLPGFLTFCSGVTLEDASAG